MMQICTDRMLLWRVLETSRHVVKIYQWNVMTTFHGDILGCFIWDVPVTSLSRAERQRYDVFTKFCCRVVHIVYHLSKNRLFEFIFIILEETTTVKVSYLIPVYCFSAFWLTTILGVFFITFFEEFTVAMCCFF